MNQVPAEAELGVSMEDALEECHHERADYQVYTRDGSVDHHGQPAIKRKTGGWIVGNLILVNQGLATLALLGVGVNMVFFMTKVLKQDNAVAANNVSNWTGTTYIFSLVGAFLGDSYWGRYKTSAIFQVIFVMGLVLLTLSSYLFLLKPCTPGVENLGCEPPKAVEVAVFYLCIYQIALGSGGYQPVITTFGADQFDEEDPDEEPSKVSFFSYFYLANNLGSIISNTALVYIEDAGQWVLAYCVSAGAALVALVLFFCGTRRYRNFKAGGNPLARICQVVVAAMKKWKVKMPMHADDLYEVDRKEYEIKGSRKILHTQQFRFLDRAAVVTYKDFNLQEQAPNPWCLCPISQVEEVKCIIRLLPIWLCTIMYSVVYTQMNSVFVEQGEAMKTKISAFHIPPASVNIFEILGVACFVIIYRRYIVLLLRNIFKLKEPTELQRMGVGLIISAMAMVAAGIVEFKRLKYAKGSCSGCDDTSSLSILWQIPQYFLVGASEVFMYVGQLEFFNKQAPDGLKSFGSALYLTSVSLGNYVSSLIMTIVMIITTRDDQPGWIADNLNKGHMDWFYFLLAALTSLDFVVFVACAKWYKCISLEGKSGTAEVDGKVLES